MTFYAKVGNLKVYYKQCLGNGFTVEVRNGVDVVSRDEWYGSESIHKAVDSMFRARHDIFTRDFLAEFSVKLFKLSEDTYRIEKNYFCRIDDTRFFKHLVEPATGWVRDKRGLRIIDR